MLMDLIMDLVMATDPKEKEHTYRKLEKIGVDRRSADAMAAEFYEQMSSDLYESVREEIERENGVREDGSC